MFWKHCLDDEKRFKIHKRFWAPSVDLSVCSCVSCQKHASVVSFAPSVFLFETKHKMLMRSSRPTRSSAAAVPARSHRSIQRTLSTAHSTGKFCSQVWSVTDFPFCFPSYQARISNWTLLASEFAVLNMQWEENWLCTLRSLRKLWQHKYGSLGPLSLFALTTRPYSHSHSYANLLSRLCLCCCLLFAPLLQLARHTTHPPHL